MPLMSGGERQSDENRLYPRVSCVSQKFKSDPEKQRKRVCGTYPQRERPEKSRCGISLNPVKRREVKPGGKGTRRYA